MIYTQMTRLAMGLAYEAHHGQTDKGGVPYIFHPVHLAEQMDDEITTTVALLHDVVEDTPWTLEALTERFPPEVIEALRLLTHGDGVSYEAYVRAIREHPVARRVKLADLQHNSDQTRLSDLCPEIRDRLREKYAAAMDLLQA